MKTELAASSSLRIRAAAVASSTTPSNSNWQRLKVWGTMVNSGISSWSRLTTLLTSIHNSRPNQLMLTPWSSKKCVWSTTSSGRTKSCQWHKLVATFNWIQNEFPPPIWSRILRTQWDLTPNHKNASSSVEIIETQRCLSMKVASTPHIKSRERSSRSATLNSVTKLVLAPLELLWGPPTRRLEKSMPLKWSERSRFSRRSMASISLERRTFWCISANQWDQRITLSLKHTMLSMILTTYISRWSSYEAVTSSVGSERMKFGWRIICNFTPLK